MKKIKVEISYKNIKKKNIYVPFIGKTVNTIVKLLIQKQIIDATIFEKKNMLSILICDDKYIRELNKQYRNINKITNELSFSYMDDFSDYIGEIVLNWDEVVRDSDNSFVDRKSAILNFISHAILHILGYTHETPEKEKEMEKIKKMIIKEIENERDRF